MMNGWVKQNTLSALHKTAVIVYGLTTFLSFFSHVFPIIGVIVFFCFTALPKIWRMLIFFAITACIVTLLPFLAPIAVILMVVFFIMRLKYIIQNWRPIIGGILVYGSFFIMFNNAYQWQYSPMGVNIFSALFTGVLAAILLHFYMKWLYRNGYSASKALEIMGAVPVVLLALILPFLKMVDFADFSLFEGTVDHAPVSAGASHTVTTETVPGGSHPGMHQVAGHMRTAPDGIIENNLSYHGPGKIPNTPTVHVDSYVRTNPDGIMENNLSYHGPDQVVSSTSIDTLPHTTASSSEGVTVTDSHVTDGVIKSSQQKRRKTD
ncbi:hypothetical protein OH784_05240 [Ectobacillus funiculus]|uniref:hypothetical protein n=1 Tax=Ectobacillus funiculus TaxID=137993 RepID=UPI00397D0177